MREPLVYTNSQQRTNYFSSKAKVVDAIVEALPDKMRAAKRWCVWKWKPAGQGKKPRKVPFYQDGKPRSGRLDDDADLARLGTLEQALEALGNGGEYAGLGFALGPDGGGGYWQGIDLDDVAAHPALELLAEDLPGYTERSPSGNGWHAIGYGRQFQALGSNGSGIEAYSAGRYFTVTGDCAGLHEPCDLEPFVSNQLRPLHAVHAGAEQAAPGAQNRISEVNDEVLADLRAALRFVSADDRAIWIRFGHALKTLGAAGKDIWLEWSATSAKYDSGDAERCWESFRPERTGHTAVFAEAQRQGWKNPRRRETSSDAPETDEKRPRLEILKLAAMLDRFVLIERGPLVLDQARRTKTRISEFKAAWAASKTAVSSGPSTRMVPTTDLWIASPDRLSVFDETFEPGFGRIWTSKKGAKYLNRWTEPEHAVPADWGERARPFFEHLDYLIPSAPDRNDFLDWLAHAVQCPAVRPHFHFLLVAAFQGTGRSWMGDLFLRMWGEHAVAQDIQKLLDADFNALAAGKVLITAHEVRTSPSERYAHADRLKSLLTDSTIEVNEKFMPKRTEKFVARFCMFTNAWDALPLTQQDRRVQVVECASTTREPEYYRTLYGRLDDAAFVASVWKALKVRDISRFNPGRMPPVNSAKELMIERSRSDIQGLTADFVRTLREFDDNQSIKPIEAITSTTFYAMLLAGIEDGEPKRKATQGIRAVLSDLGVAFHHEKIFFDGNATRVLILSGTFGRGACERLRVREACNHAKTVTAVRFTSAEAMIGYHWELKHKNQDIAEAM